MLSADAGGRGTLPLACGDLVGGYARQCYVDANGPIESTQDLDYAVDVVTGVAAVGLAGKVAVDALGKPTIKVAGRIWCKVFCKKTASTIAANRLAGDAFAEAIAGAIPGSGPRVFGTRLGYRAVDVFDPVRGTAIEAKVGRTSLTKFVRRQVLKDVALLRDPESGVRSVEWVFKTSDVTGLGGPTKPLQVMLESYARKGVKISWRLVP